MARNVYSQGKGNAKYITAIQGSWTYSTKYKLQLFHTPLAVVINTDAEKYEKYTCTSCEIYFWV